MIPVFIYSNPTPLMWKESLQQTLPSNCHWNLYNCFAINSIGMIKHYVVHLVKAIDVIINKEYYIFKICKEEVTMPESLLLVFAHPDDESSPSAGVRDSSQLRRASSCPSDRHRKSRPRHHRHGDQPALRSGQVHGSGQSGRNASGPCPAVVRSTAAGGSRGEILGLCAIW